MNSLDSSAANNRGMDERPNSPLLKGDKQDNIAKTHEINDLRNQIDTYETKFNELTIQNQVTIYYIFFDIFYIFILCVCILYYIIYVYCCYIENIMCVSMEF